MAVYEPCLACGAGMLAIVYFSHAFSPPAVPSDPVEAAAKSYYNSKVGVYAAVAFYLGAALSSFSVLGLLTAVFCYQLLTSFSCYTLALFEQHERRPGEYA